MPVKIHNLDPEDKTLLENELGGVLRSIDFIYTEAGVNRPLRPNDDAKENLNKTQYRNQVNKLANAVKEIIAVSRNFSINSKDSSSDNLVSANTSSPGEDKELQSKNSFLVVHNHRTVGVCIFLVAITF